MAGTPVFEGSEYSYKDNVVVVKVNDWKSVSVKAVALSGDCGEGSKEKKAPHSDEKWNL